MDKLLRDMDDLCQTTAKEREERYHASCRATEISEMLLSDDEIVCGGGKDIRSPLIYGKTYEETLRDIADELQDMIELLKSMDKVEDCSVDDMLKQLEASISVYNSERGM